MEDSEIIDLFYARSERAITELAGKYGGVCTRVAENILNNSLDAEECVNDAYLGAWESIPPTRPQPLKAYICRIVRNLSIRKYHANTAVKRNSYYDAALDELEDCLASKTGVEEEVSVRELAALIDEFLDTLNQDSRVMFVRRYWYADSIAGLAARFGTTENNISVRLFRTREKLRDYLERRGICI